MNKKIFLPVLATLLLGVLSACEKDPNEAQTWIDKLDDMPELDEAVRNLERLKDPAAIKPLGALWKKLNHPSKLLRVIIAISNKDEKGAAHYQEAVPFLLEAVDQFDTGDEKSIDDANVACEALGKARDPRAVPILISVAQKAMPKLSPANKVRIAAVKALGKFRDPKAVDLLMKVLAADVESQRLQLHAAAALALAETGDPKALPALMQALFIGPIYNQVRTAVTRIGKAAVPTVTAMYQEKEPAIQALAKQKNFAEKAPGTVIFKGALLLGDMRVKAAVPMLITGLEAEPKISYYDEKTGQPGPITHMAILQALQAIGDSSAAAAVWAYSQNPRTNPAVKPRAIDVYSWLAKDGSALPELLKTIKDDKADEQARFASIISYGRIARSNAAAKAIDELIAGYAAKVKTAEDKAKAAKTAQEKEAAEAEGQMPTAWRDALTETKNRIAVALECKDDAICYGKAITASDIAVGKPGLPRAERAMIELYRMEDKGRPALDQVLKVADATERMIRDGVHLVLPRIAPMPCAKCAERLQQVLESQSSQTTLDALNADTRIVYHYFLASGT